MISDNGQYNRLFVLRDSETETVRLVCVRDSDPQQDLVLWTAYSKFA